MKGEPATHLGRQLRGGRQTAHRTQRDLGEEIGLSQPVISRMELGLGGRIGLDVWAAAGEAVGLRLQVDLVGAAEAAARSGLTEVPHPCVQLLVDVANEGGWSPDALSAQDGHTTTLHRRSRDERHREVAIVQAWPLVTQVESEIRRFRSMLEDQRERMEDESSVSGVVVVPATYANRRRMTESRIALSAAFPATGREWFGAIASRVRRMPNQAGILWAFPDCGRLRPAPFLPGWVWTVPGDGPKFMRPRRRGGA